MTVSNGTYKAALGVGVVALMVWAVVSFPTWLEKAQSPSVAMVTTLKASEVQGLRMEDPASGHALLASHHQFQRLSVDWQAEGKNAQIVGTLDFTGKFGRTAVSSLGLETVSFTLHEGEWRPQHGLAPRLMSIVAFLERRRRALEEANLTALKALGEKPIDEEAVAWKNWLQVAERKLEVTAWYLRSDRDEVLVREEFRVTGHTPERPLYERGTRSLILVPQPDGWKVKGPVWEE